MEYVQIGNFEKTENGVLNLLIILYYLKYLTLPLLTPKLGF
jgi:hypothetical protein